MDLEQQVREHYRDQTLRPELAERLLAAAQAPKGEQEASSPSHPTRKERLSKPPSALWISQLAAVLLFIALAWAGLSSQLSTDSLATAIRQEVATNHKKRLAPEFDTRDLTALVVEMTKLDFQLTDSTRPKARRLSLQGARYCSIQGVLAAQLQFEDPSGRQWTLYQAPSNQDIARVTPSTATIDGVTVELWQEDGVFFALAVTPQEGQDSPLSG